MATQEPVGPEVRAGALPGGSRQLSDQVAAYLREAIMVGELPAASYIRTEHIASRLGVSATPVREALVILHSEGAVRWEPRRGFRVVPLTRGDVEDLFAVQAHIAGELAARAADGFGPDRMAEVAGLQGELEAAAARGELARVDELNHRIHRLVNLAAAAPRLASMLNLFVHYVPRNYYGQVPGWSAATTHDHGAVLAALRREDPAAARSAMEEHILNIGRLLVGHLETTGVLWPADGEPRDGAGAAGAGVSRANRV